MTTATAIAFWAVAGLLFYGYAGYPLLVALAARLLDRRVRSAPVTPRLSVLVAAFNEERVIRDRLENALSSDYPAEALEVIVASDGSTDATERIVAGFGSERVRLLSLPRRGKAHALNEAARRARGEILVFTDANTVFEPAALRALVRSFADPAVGGVVGHTLYRTDGSRGPRLRSGGRRPESAGRGEDLYWRYDTWLKRRESRTGSVVSAHGGLYAVRRELFRLEDPAVTDDFAVSTAVVEQGRRLVFEAGARAYEAPVDESVRDFRRRVRLMTRGLRGVLLRRRLLNPLDHGFYAVALFSRKLLRRLLPLVLPVLLVSSVALASRGVVYAAAAAAQLLFYALAAAGWALRGTRLGHRRLFYVPFYFCLANLASLVAVGNVVRGRRIARWSPQRHGAAGAEPSVRERPGPSAEASDLPPAVVIGLDCVTGLQTARILAARGIPVIGVASDVRHPCARTRVCREIVEADADAPELMDVLRELATRIGGDAVLFPCTDRSVLRLARDRCELPPTLRLVLPETEVVETLLDKARFQAMARERGFPIPETRLIRSREEAVAASWSMSFPCVLKPPVKTRRWETLTAAKVFKASTPATLLALYDRFASSFEALVVQEWLPGMDTDHYTCNCYFGDESRPLVCFTTRKLRQWPPVGGQGSLSEECRNDRVRDETVRLFQTVGHRGFGYLEMMWDERTGRHLILEANVGRPTGRAATAEAAGVEFLLTAYRHALNLPLPDDRIQLFRGVKWLHLRHDLQAAIVLWRRGALTVRQWLDSLRGPRTHALLSWNDPVPFVADLLRTAGKLAKGTSAVPERAGARYEEETAAGTGEGARAAGGSGGRRSPRRRAVEFETATGVRVQLVDPSPADVRSAARILGAPGTLPRAEATIRIRYVEALPVSGLRLLEGGASGYADDGFYLLRSRSGDPIARIRVGDAEPFSELVCVRDLGRVPLLQPLVDLESLALGWAPVHASAWIQRGLGVLAAGWDRSGKTGSLLVSGDRGASFVGDDRVMLHRLGDRMVGFHRPITVRDWHMAQLPRVARRVAGPVRRRLVGAGPRLERLGDRLVAGRSDGLAGRAVARGVSRLRSRLGRTVDPERIFGEDRCPGRGAPRAAFLLVSHDDDSVRIEPIESADLAARLATLVRVELEPLVRTYLALRFAFPACRWTLLDTAHERAGRILGGALAGKSTFVVRHPYPCPLSELYAAMDGVLAEGADRDSAPARSRRKPSRTRPGSRRPVSSPGSSRDEP